MLRLIGVHTIHQYDKKDQRGKADGFFKIGNLAVMYDCTLENDFEKSKNVQIDNYSAQLQKDRIRIDSNEYGLKNCDKVVWIITKNGKSRLIKKSDDVEIKEISILDLIEVYHKRLDDSSINEKQLVKILAGI